MVGLGVGSGNGGVGVGLGVGSFDGVGGGLIDGKCVWVWGRPRRGQVCGHRARHAHGNAGGGETRGQRQALRRQRFTARRIGGCDKHCDDNDAQPDCISHGRRGRNVRYARTIMNAYHVS